MLPPGFAATLDAGPAGARPAGLAGRPSREASATRSSHGGALRALGVAVLAAGVLLAGLLVPAPVSAQSPVSVPVEAPEPTQAPGMLVSNHHLAADDTEDLATDRVWAQPFTTGASPTGYVLANVKLLVDASNASPNPRVQVYTFDGQEPGSLVATLNNPATIVADAVNVFTAPAGTELDASTIYFIVGGYGSDRSKRFVIRTVAGGSEDPASASGWRIDINSLFKGRYSGTSWKRSDKSAYLRVEGAERIAATDATLRGLALSAGTLDPAFAAGTTSYTATVAHHVERVTVMPAANDEARATIAYLDERGNPLADADGTTDAFQVDLEVGDTTIAVEVTAEDRVTTRTYTLTVTRGEALRVTLAANPARLWEGAGPTEVTVTATLDGTWPTDTDITLAVAGSGEAGAVDFAAVEDIVLTVPAFARAATATFTLTPDDDAIDERDETVTVSGTVDAAPDLEVLPAKLVLSDEEAPSRLVVLSLSRTELSEDGGAAAVTVTAILDGDARSEDTAVAVTVSGSGEAGVVGFAAVAPFTLTIPAGYTSAAAVLTVAPEDDYIDEADETVTVAGTAALTVAPAALTLVDDDATSTKLHWTISPLEIPEGAGPTEVTVTVRLDAAALPQDTEVVGTAAPNVTEDINHAGRHERGSFNFRFTLPAGATTATSVFTLTPVQDDIAEGSDPAANQVNVRLAHNLRTVPDAGLPVTSVTEVILTLIDDDSPGPDVDLGYCSHPSIPLYINFRVHAGLGGAPVTGFVQEDLVVENAIVTNFSGSGSAYAVEFLVADEFQGEVTLTVPFGVTEDADGQVNNAASCTSFIDRRSPRVAITGPADGGPVHGPFVVRIVFDEAVSGFELADLTVGNGTVSSLRAIEASGDGASYAEYVATITPVGSGEVTVDVAAGQANDSQSNDNLAAAQYGIEMEAPEVALALSRTELSEGSGAAAVTVTATLDGDARSEDTAVAVTVSGSGEAGVVGFAPVAPFTLTIPVGHTSAAAVITVAPEDDYTDETDETVTVAGTAALTVAPATLTLVDDDATSTKLHWTISPLEIPEGAGPTEVTVTVRLDAAALPQDTEVVGTAAPNVTEDINHAGRHERGSFNFRFTLPAGATTATSVFTLTPVQDDIAEGSDPAANQVNVRLAHNLRTVPDAGLPVTSVTEVILTLIDDDSPGPDVDLGYCSHPSIPLYINFRVHAGLGGAPVTGFVQEDLVVENATVTNFSGSGSAYAVEFLVADEFQGEVTLTVPFGVTEDADGQVNNAASCTSFIDRRSPRVAITGPADGGPVHGPFVVRIVFDEAVSGFELADLTVGNGTVSSLRAIEASGDGASYAEYVATITPVGSGEVTVDVAAGQANDSQSNDNLAAAQYGIEMEAPEVALALSRTELSEGSGATEVTVTATVAGGALVEDLPVAVTVSGSGDAGVVGFATVPDFTLTIPARRTEATATFNLTPTDDATAAADETVTVGGTASLPWIAVEPATLSLLDNDEASTALLLAVTPATIAEGAGATQVTVTATLDGAARNVETEVTVTVSGPDTAGVEFAAVEPVILTIAAGAASGSASFTLTPADDAWDRADTAVSLTAALTEEVSVGVVEEGTTDQTGLASGRATVLLTDDDEASTRVSLSLSVTEVAEAAGATEVTVTAKLSGAPREEATDLALSVAGVTAEAADFAAVPDFTLTFPAGDTSVEGTFTLAPVADALDEASETLAVRGVAAGLAVPPATLAIVDDDDPPALAIAGAAAAEDAGELAFAVTLDAPSGREVTVSFATADGTALAPADYLAARGTLTFAPGATERTLAVTLVDDYLHEEAETFTVTLSDSAHATLAEAVAEGRIDDDDPMPGVPLSTDATLRGLALSAGALDPAFAAGTTSYTATVANRVERATVLPAANDEARAKIAYLDEHGNPLLDADGAADGFQVDLEVGDTTIKVKVTAQDRVTTRTYTLTVTRGEALSVMLEANPARLWEGAGPTEVTVTATLDGTWPTDTAITLAVAGSGADGVVGFAAVEDIVLTVPAFARVATATFTLTPDDDLTDERDETVTVSGAVDAAPDLEVLPAKLVLSDEEAPSRLVALALSRTELSEDGGAAAVTVTATLDGDARSEDTAVAVTVSGSGEAGVVGFAPVAPFTLTIPVGHTSAAAVITVAPEDDYTDETDETVTVAGTAALTVAPATLTLVDDDATSTKLHWTISPLEIPEGAGPTEVTVTVRLDAAALPQDTEVVGTAAPNVTEDINHAGRHERGSFNFRFTLPAGATTATSVFTLTPVQDDIAEGSDPAANQVNVRLAHNLRTVPDAGLPVTSVTEVILTLIDDDSPGPDVDLGYCSHPSIPLYINFRVHAGLGGAPVTGFVQEDLVVENAIVTNFSGSGSAYAVEFLVADEFQGEVTLTVPFGVTEDADGQVNNAASCTSFIDRRSPRVAITGPADGGPVHGPFVVRIVFDEAVSGFELADLTVGNGTVSSLRAIEASGDGASYAEYVATITPVGSGEVTVDVAAGQANDSQSNDNLAAAQYGIEMEAPEVALALSRTELSEGSGATEVTVTATLDEDARSEDIAVAVTVSGSGEAGVVGFAPVAPFTLTIPAGHTNAAAVITVAPEDDYIDETDETITVAGTAALTVAPATLTLVDDDATSTKLHWTISPLEIPEGAGPTEVTVTVRLDAAALPQDTEVVGTAAPNVTEDINHAGRHERGSFNFRFTLPAGATTATSVFTLTPVQDDIAEGSDPAANQVNVRLAHNLRTVPDAGLPVTSVTEVILTLIDDDSPGPDVDLGYCSHPSIPLYINFRVHAGLGGAPVTGFVQEDLVVENATVTNFSGSGSAYAVEFLVADEFQGEVTLTVPFGVTEDADGQVNNAASCTSFIDRRSPRVAITGPAGGGPVHGPFAVRIVFDEPVSGFELADLTVGNGTASEVRPVEASQGELPRFYAEYVATITPAGSGEVTVDVAAGQANDSQSNDNLAAAQYGIEMEAPEVVLSLSHSELSEGSGATGVTVIATVEGGALVEDLPVTVAVSGSGDAGVMSFAAVPDFTLTIPARQTEATATFTLTPADDGTAAADETVTVRGTASLPWIAVEPATLSLLDNDEASTALLLAVTPATIAEGAGATQVTVTATLDGAARNVETEVTVTLSGPDTAGVEFAAVEPVILTIAAGAASGSASFTLTPTDDAWDRPDTAVALTAAATNEVAIGVEGGTTEQTSLTSGRATVLLTDDDEASTRVSLSLSVTELAEAAAATEVTVTARLSGAPREEATDLALSVAGVTAKAADFAAVSDFILTFPAGDTSAEGTFTLAPAADALDEASETLAVRGVAAGLTVPPATLAILDDDDPPALSIAGAAAAEGAGELAFVATLDAPSGREVTVSFATADGTALAPADYLAARGTLTFAPGVTERTLAVTLVDDDLHEEGEDLTVTLSDPAHATLVQALAEGRIVDDDPMPRVRLTVAAPADGVVTEGGGAAVVTLIGRLEGAARSAPTVASLSVTGGTASAADFAAVPAFTLTIPPGATAAAAAFTLTPVDDTVAEPPETLTVGSRAADVVVVPATVTIVDDDDVTAPALSGATVEGALLALTYDETLDGASVPAPGAFTVRVARPAPEPPSPADLLDVEGPQTGTEVVTDEPTQAVSDTAAEGRQVSVVAVVVEGRRVTLTLASAVASGDRVTVSYAPPPAGPATGPIRDRAGNGAAGLSGYPVDSGTPPVVLAVALVSTPTGGAYGVGEKIRARVTFSETVTVTGRPRLALDVGGTRRDALYVAGESSGARLVFVYEVASGDSDPDGVAIVADSLDTKGGAGITDGESNPAVLRHAGLAAQVSQQVDGVAAELEGAVVRGATLVLTWNEALDESATPPGASAFVVTAGDETRPVAASLVAGRTVTLTLDRAVRHGEVVTVGYTPPAEDPLRDAAGTPAAALAAAAVANETSAATDAKLGTLALSDVTLAPDVAAEVLRYSAAVEHTVRVTTVTAQANDHPFAAVTVGGEDADPDAPGHQVALVVGENPVAVTVTAQDGKTARTYTVTVTRAAPPVSVEFGAAEYSVAEGDGVALEVRLDADPERTVEIPLTVAPAREDLAGVPASVTFAAGETARTFTVTVSDDEVDEDEQTVTFGFGPLPDRVTAADPSSAALVVTNDDHTPVITTASPLEAEENRTAVATLEAADGDGDAADLTWRITGGADAAHFELSEAGELRFGEAKDYEAPDDADADGAYQVTVAVSDGTNEGEAALEVVLRDGDEVAPALESAAVDGAALVLKWNEGLDGASVPAPDAFKVQVVAAGGEPAELAVNAVEVGVASVTLALAKPVTAADVVTVSYRPPETGAIRDLAGNPAAALAGRAVDNHTPRRLAIGAATAREDAGTIAFPVTLNIASTAELKVDWTVADGTATSADYATPNGVLTMGAGTTSATIEVEVTDDTLAEADETLEVRLAAPPASARVTLGTAAATGTIEDDDELSAAVSVAAEVAEGAVASFSVTLTGATSSADVVVGYEVGGTAAPGTDYTAPEAPLELTIPAGEASGTIPIATLTDPLLDPGETLTVTLSGAGTAAGNVAVSAAAAEATATVTITDVGMAQAAPTGRPAILGTAEVGEPLTASVADIVDPNGLANATFRYQWLRGDDAGAAGTEIAGATSSTYTPVEADQGKHLRVRVKFTDDRGTEEVLTSASTAAPVPMLFTATWQDVPSSHDGTRVFRVRVLFSEPAKVGYQALRNESIKVVGGTVTKAIRVADANGVKRDDLREIRIRPTTRSYVRVTLAGGRACGTSGAICTEDERALWNTLRLTVPGPASTGLPTISIAPSTAPKTEGSAAGFVLSRTGDVSLPLTVVVAASESGAMLDGETPAEVLFEAGRASVALTLVTADDEAEEPASAVTVAVVEAQGAGYLVATDAGSATVTVDDDDAPVSVSIAASASTSTEGSAAGFVLSRTGDVSLPLTVTVAASESGAMLDGETPTEVLFEAGQASVALTLAIADDEAEEAASAITVTLVAGAGYVVAADAGSATVTVDDDDTPVPVSIAASAASPTEGTPAGFVFTRTGNTDALLTVTVAASESGAMLDGESPTEVRFAAGRSRVALTLATADDEAAEAASAVTVTLVAGTGYVVAADAGSATVTVSDDDAAPVVTTAATLSVAENATAVATLEATDEDTPAESLAWSIAGGADAGAFSVTGAGDLSFRAAKDYESPDDADGDGSYEVTVRVTDGANPVDAALVVSLADVAEVSPVSVSIAAASSSVTEGQDAVFTLSRTGDAQDSLAVTVSVSAVGAVLEGAAPAAVTFAAESSTATLRVATADDATAEADGRISASVAAGPGYAAAAGVARVDVLDNDRSGATPTVLWSAEMTVVDDKNGSIGAASAELFSNEGGSAGLDGQGLWYDTSQRKLHLSFTTGIPEAEDLTLHVDGVAFALPKDSGGSSSVTFEKVDVAWDDGATVAVRLTGTVAEDDATSAPELSVADAQVQEAAGAELAFRVTLSAAQAEAVSVRYVTADGTAKSGSDYVAVQGAVRFAPGETSKTVAVAVLDDAHDDGSETMTLTLSAPFGAELGDGEATGTIVNSDPVPKAWLARFGRTVAGHVVDAIGERFEGSHGGGSHLTLGGERVSLGAGAVPPGGELPARNDEAAAREGLSSLVDRIAGDAWTAWEAGGSNEDGTRPMTERELLLGSSFRLTLGGDGEGAGAADTRWTAWGRAAASRFDGKADGLTLDGDVTTFTLGADAAWSRWLAGMAVSLSEGEGAFRDHAATGDAAHEHRGTGTLESSLTSVHPYLRYQASERLSVWGVLGAGSGDLTLELDEGERWTTDTAMEMAAAGMRGVLVPARETGGFELAARSDAQLVRMRSDAATGSNLPATDTDTTRVRVMLEGSRAFALDGGGALAPTFEAGLRHDGGDAETGAGIELGGGLRYTVPAAGLTAEAKVRGLVAHQDADYSEWGASGSLRVEPHASGRGLSLTLAPLWGADSGGAERLWSAADARGLGHADDASAPGGRLDAEVGYGFTVLGGRAVATPHAAWSRSKESETLRLGQRLQLGGSHWHLESEVAEDAQTLRAGYGLRLGPSGDLGLEASRRDAADGNGDGYELMLRARLRW